MQWPQTNSSAGQLPQHPATRQISYIPLASIRCVACLCFLRLCLHRAILPRLQYYDQGTCIVHHIFGGETCEVVREAYGDAYLTAHFEVPGEMFTLAMQVGRAWLRHNGNTVFSLKMHRSVLTSSSD